MAAKITNTNGRDEMFYTGETPWHGLGKRLDDFATSEQALEAAGLGWEVERRQAYCPDNAGQIVAMPERFAIVRKDTDAPLGVVGPDYTPLQNKDAFAFMDAVIGEKAAVYETAGSLMGGRKVWALARLEGVMRIKGDDVLNKYLFLSNGHDGWQAVKVALTAVRVVCWNTYSAALSKAKDEKKLVSLRHDKALGRKVTATREALGLINKSFEALELQQQRMAARQVSQKDLGEYFKGLGFDPELEATQDKFLDLVKAFETSPGSELPSAKGTLWGAFNAVTWYMDHGREFSARKPDAESSRFANLMVGDGARTKRKAFDLALSMAK